MRNIIIIIFTAILFSSCVGNDFDELSYISLGGDTIYEPEVIVTKKFFCYGDYHFRVEINAELEDGTYINFVLIADELGNNQQISVHDFEANTIKSKCDGGTMQVYVNEVYAGGFWDITEEKFNLSGLIGMECKQTEDTGFGDWRPIDEDIVLYLVNIPL